MIRLGFATPSQLKGISDDEYRAIQNQLSLVIQGQLYLYGHNLNGKIDGIVADLCSRPTLINDKMCSCFNMKYGSSCDNDNLGTQCRVSGYKNTTQLQQKCVQSLAPINITDNTSIQTTNVTLSEGSVLGSISQQ